MRHDQTHGGTSPPASAPSEHGSHHEHPEPYSPLPLIQPRTLRSIRAALGDEEVARRKLGEIEARVRGVERLVRAARLVADSPEPGPDFLDAAIAELQSLAGDARPQPPRRPAPVAVDPASPFGCPADPAGHDADDEGASVASAKGGVGFGASVSISPLVDVLVGLTYAYPNDTHASRTRAQTVLTAIEDLVFPLMAAEKALATVARSAEALADRVALALLRPESAGPTTAGAFVTAGSALVERWHDANPVAAVLVAPDLDALSERIAGIEPPSAAAGDMLTLRAREDQPFPAKPDADVGIYGQEGRTELPIVSWSATKIVVRVPDLAATGHVFFGRRQDRGRAADALGDWSKLLAREWQTTCLPVLARFGIRRPAYCNRAESNHLTVERPPVLTWVRLVDGLGGSVETFDRLLDAAKGLSVRWRTWDANADDRCQLVLDGNVVRDDLPTIGSLALPPEIANPEQLRRMELRIRPRPNRPAPEPSAGGGREHPPLDTPQLPAPRPRLPSALPLFPGFRFPRILPLRFSVDAVRLSVPSDRTAPGGGNVAGANVTVSLPFSAGVAGDVSASSSSPRVTVETHARLNPYIQVLYLNVFADSYDRDRPGEPCAVISVSVRIGADQFLGTIEVWVEPSGGAWKVVGQLTTVGIHTALLDNGQQLFFSPDRNDIGKQENVETELWDPVSRTSLGADSPPPDRTRNLFCAGHCHLPDGRILVAGGHAVWPAAGGYRATDWSVHVYDPHQAVGARWMRADDMTEARWYPTCLVLPDGKALIASGSCAGPYAPVSNGLGLFGSVGWTGDLPTVFLIHLSGGTATSLDVFDGATNTLQKFCDADFLDCWSDTYPYMAVLPSGPDFTNGAVLAIERSHLHYFAYDPQGSRSPLSGHVQMDLAFPSRRTFPKYGGGVLLPIHATNPEQVRFLILGGGDERNHDLWDHADSTDTLEIIDFVPSLPLSAQPRPSTSRSLRMSRRRFMTDAVLLPDGNVLICGGARFGITNINSEPVRETQLFDSVTETLSDMETATVERRYHSTHVLLADGTIQATGSTGGYPPGDTNPQFDVEVFHPPYLWRGRRPVLTAPPGTIRYGQPVTLDSVDAQRIRRVGLVRLASVTHANNMGQRFIELPITGVQISSPARPSDHVVVNAPRDGTIAPPGPYFLFAIDALGVPSVGSVVFVRA